MKNIHTIDEARLGIMLNELRLPTSYSSWSPYMAPIQIVMVAGICLRFLQTTSIFFKDLAKALGREMA